MNKKNTSKNANYWVSRVNKLVVGRSVVVPGYATVACHAKAGPNKSRRFKISSVAENLGVKAGGNLSFATVSADIRSFVAA